MRGSLVPLVTPFHRGRFDAARFEELVEWQIESGSHGLVVTGTTGEPAALSPEEREEVLATAVRAARRRVPVIAGTGTNNYAETLRLTQAARRLGADAALVVVPYYVRPSQEGLYRYFRSLAEAVDIPIIVYNIPARTAVNLEPPTLARLARDCPTIIGVKEANRDFEHVTRVLHLCGPGFFVYSGIELLCFPILAVGGAGHVSAAGNVLPREVARLYDLAASGRWEEARALHYHLLPMNEALFVETNPVPVKTALGLMGKIDPEVRPPLAPMSAENTARLRQVMAAYGLVATGNAAPVGG
ncbi:MAG: 4-hydroxy-tetrahydrodipicolinate synthase [Armatimonadota bacterium]|nr:4-hydroxy-tetrahydrodipicolinate synthase [Armatimonadota bacterium]MDR7452408.1 4-hydroxy-tetrahydrodipicolinate synthase [Armatimonadota bacterium]MDR7468101.1 4-hydroxy-tetrahydrodipicolinate synthase [Armatimonadota bacterium]MDR7494671.1 4-hydroxy-tetrahydrodipicolinate synthase [Armatimonadota bacterium]MDR7500196.1 4-hydroxy-tetrahydrodipicolinate synthase [Armatimonadota bacterium]